MNFKKSNLLFKSFSNPIKLGISLAIVALNSEASRVRGDVDYQYFRDFGENKGLFSIGATNIHIFDKNGQDVGIMLKDNIPMPDLKTANKNGAFANLIDPSFITSVRHNVGYSQVLFGGEDTNPDSHHFSYLLVNRNNFPDEWDGVTYSNPQDKDYHIPRLHKMVTEVAPAELTDVLTPNGKENTKILTDLTRFPLYIRVGSGKQEVQESAEDNSKTISLSSAYKYVIGGVTHTMSEANATNVVANGTITPEGKRITDKPITLFGSIYGPMVSYGRSGDSGSALLGYDAQKKKWVIVGVLKSDYGYGNIWSLSRPSYVNAIQERAKAGTIQNTQQNQVWEWSVDALHPETSSIKAGESTALAVPLRNESLKSQDTDKERPSLDYGKSVIFDGVDGGVLLVKDNINAGAGALYFNTNFTVKPETNQTWLGGGVLVAKDKTVTWKIANPEGDRLSKLGTGTLLVQGVGNNLGDISIGDGTVILDQQEDEQGRKQAFNQVGVVSGRPTLILQSADQIDPNKLYFGFRGGRLDLNGNDLSFKRIQHSDDGATVVNHRTDKSSNLTLTGVTVSEQDLTWGNWGKAGSDIYEYAISGRKDYFALKSGGKAGSYYPTNQASSDSWEYLGSDRAAAIQTIIDRKNAQQTLTAFAGYFGEKASDKTNGGLNVNYQPVVEESTLLLTGGMNLNGDFSAKGGKVVLEGVPTPHARDVLNNREVIFDDDWINRDFSAKTISVSNKANFTVGRNVSSLNANINANDNAILNLGYQAGQTVCLRSDHTGEVSCDMPTYSEETLNSIPRMALAGDISLSQQSRLNLGKTDFTGSIQAANTTQTSLSKESHWTLTGNSTLGNLNLAEGSQITLSQNDKPFNTLTVNGDLSGNGKFYYRTNFSTLNSDKVVVNGKASGNHLLVVNDIGNEPQRSKDRLTLITANSSENLTVTLQNSYADIGAYRYNLIQEGSTFRLYNPIVEKEIAEEERKAAEEQARREAEAKRLEEERKAAEEQARREAEAKRLEEERKAAEEQARREAEAKRLEEERKAAEEQARREAEAKRLEEERKAAEEQARREAEAKRLEEERKAAEEQARREAEAKRLEEERKAAEEQARREAEAKRLEEERKAAEEQARREAEAKRLEEERKAAEEQARREVEAKRLEEERKAAEEQARREAEAKRLEEERKATEEQARREAEAKRLEEERKAAEEQARREAEAKRLEEERKAAEEQARREAEAKRLEEERKAAEEQARREAEAKRLEEERKATEEQARREAEAKRLEEERKKAELDRLKQAQLVSGVSNTALSELSAQGNAILRSDQHLNQRLLQEGGEQTQVWTNVDYQEADYQSDNYRVYKQHSNYTELGVESAVNEQGISLGTIVSQTRGNIDYENASGKMTYSQATVYAKVQSESGLFVAADIGYGRSNNLITLDEQRADFKRNIVSFGATLGKKWALGYLDLKAIAGVRYHHLTAADYELKGRAVHTRALDFVNYHAGAELSKTWQWNTLSISPSLALYYFDASRKTFNNAVTVNNNVLQQQFNRGWQYQAGLNLNMGAWSVGTTFFYENGDESSHSRQFGLKVGYRF
ncbi:Immunoglobulin A1 protease autotransporter precursor [uncultured Avibacterium sp.]|uniref:Immunoglobulin A1 protease autotransporter n=1 Tax=uncultured Avibacterium sp. TaxID=1936169 RepID=A0A486XCF2_9PAST|nr:Immunoglobulin A1 protease autotransporter precursor [uncultured Avibacterium sp.]